MGNLNSDGRILFLLGGGDAMRMHVDPEGILGSAAVSSLSYNPGRDGDAWTLTVAFASGDVLRIGGVASDDGVCLIDSVTLYAGRQRIQIPLAGAETLLEAFGDLSGLPVQLKRNLSCTPRGNAAAGLLEFNCRRFFDLARDALFYGVEGGETGSPYRDAFGGITVRYTAGEDGRASSLTMTSVARVEGGRIVVSTGLDIYGLNGKAVELKYEVGMGYQASCDCVVTSGRTRPSLRLAYYLAAKLSGDDGQRRRYFSTMASRRRPATPGMVTLEEEAARQAAQAEDDARRQEFLRGLLDNDAALRVSGPRRKR